MHKDPYRVLGISETASDEEIKQAYRRLAKKYHPDTHPGDAEAEQKMKEINAAYDEIMNRRRQAGGPAGQGFSGQGSYGPFGGGYDPFGRYGPFGGYGEQYGYGAEESPYLQAAFSYIANGSFREALNVLDGIEERNARWYFLSALAHAGLGNRIQALEHARRAVAMEPDNFEYRSFLEWLQSPIRDYGSFAGQYGRPAIDLDKCCLGLCCLRLFCYFCGC
jgi:molecular chaperone DnaJ